MSCGNPLNHLANNVKDSFGGVPAIGGEKGPIDYLSPDLTFSPM